MRNAGQSCSEIGRHYGITRQAVSDRLRRNTEIVGGEIENEITIRASSLNPAPANANRDGGRFGDTPPSQNQEGQCVTN